MENIISKELLSEVLDIEILAFNQISKNELEILSFEEPFIFNIHELAHKCKEWAVNEKGYAWIIMNFCVKILNLETGEVKEFKYEQEDMLNKIPHLPKYEIMACQWILDNKA